MREAGTRARALLPADDPDDGRSVLSAGYEADRSSSATLTAAANATPGRIVDEGDVGDVAARVRQPLGIGPTLDRRIEGSRRAHMPFVALLAVFPLGLVLLRRNA